MGGEKTEGKGEREEGEGDIVEGEGEEGLRSEGGPSFLFLVPPSSPSLLSHPSPSLFTKLVRRVKKRQRKYKSISE